TGEMGFRAEADTSWATDGECGTVLRIYREHQMAPDSTFLQRNWPRIKLALQFLIGHDAGSDGTIDGPQPNTLDQVWYGEIAWISGMYVAALRAGAQMADEVGDGAFATACSHLAALRCRHGSRRTRVVGRHLLQRVLDGTGVSARDADALRRRRRGRSDRHPGSPRPVRRWETQPVQRDRVRRTLRAGDGRLRRL